MLTRLSSVETANHVMLSAPMLMAAPLLESVQITAMLATLRMEIPALLVLAAPAVDVMLVPCPVAALPALRVPLVTRTSVLDVQTDPSSTPQTKPASPATRQTAKLVTLTTPPDVTHAKMVTARMDPMDATAAWTLTAPCVPVTTTSVPPAQLVTV